MLMLTGAILLHAGVVAITSNQSEGLSVVAFPLGLFFLIWGVLDHRQSAKSEK